MNIIKDNDQSTTNPVGIAKLTVNKCYKFEKAVCYSFISNIKTIHSPLKTVSTHTYKSTVLARLLCILSKKRIKRVVKELKGLKVCWYVH